MILKFILISTYGVSIEDGMGREQERVTRDAAND